MTDPGRWRQARDLFEEALSFEGEARARWLDAACADAELRARVDELLAADTGTLAAPDVAGALRDTLDEEELGQKLGPWRLRRRLGTGGMGTVFLAEREDEIEQRVAVKVLHEHLAWGEGANRFRLEKQLLAVLDHGHLARLLDHGTTPEGRPYLVMEWVDGSPITEYCDRHRLDLDRRLELVRDLAAALHYAHRHRVVHRDIKPSNILVTEDGVAKMLDFGIAKALEGSRFDEAAPESTVHGRPLSPAYASPEQLSGDAVTTASDIYSLAVVTFELLTGSSPFRAAVGSIRGMQALYERGDAPTLLSALPAGRGVREVAALRGCREKSLRRELSGDLQAVLDKAMDPEPERRYTSIAQFSDDLRRARAHWPVAARAPKALYRLRLMVRRNRLVSVLLALAVMSTLALTIALGVQSRRLAEERDMAVREERRASQVTEFLADIFRRVDPEHSGGPTTSVEMLLDAARRIDDEFAGDDRTAARLLDLVAHALQNLGELDEAAPFFRRALDLRQGLAPDLRRAESSVELQGAIASSLDALGKNLRLRGDFAAAEDVGRQALERRVELLGESHGAVAESLANLAEALHELGRYDEAEPLYDRALAIRLRLFGESHVLVAESLDQQALLWLNRDQDEKALGHYRRALDIRLRLLPEHHPQVAAAYYHVGTVEQNLGRRAVARENLERALELFRRVYGDQHPRLAHCLHDLGVLALDDGELEEAHRLVRQALDMRRTLFPGNHSDLIQSLGTLGGVLARQGQLEAAKGALDEALERSRRLFGDRHPYVAITLRHLAEVKSRAGDSAAAADLIREAVGILERAVGDEDAETWKARVQLAQYLWQSGERQEARKLMERSRQGLVRALGADHPGSLKASRWLAEKALESS